MWPFNRKKTKVTTVTKVPAEVQDYYETGRRERTGMAWLLGIITLIVTILLALLLFFAGRWVYRKASNKDHSSGKTDTSKTETTSQSVNSPNSSNTSSGGSSSENSNSSSSGSTNSSTGSGATGTSSTGTSGSSTNSTEPLPRTGPDPNDPN